MSIPPVQPENAAPAAPVRPSGPAKSPTALDAQPPLHTVASPSGEASARAHGSSVHEEGLPPHSPNLSQETPSPSSNASTNKWSRGPLPQPRSTGPSLLTQALATARATPHGQAELSQSPPTTPRRSEADTSSVDPAQNDHDASAYQSDGDTVTPRGSPSTAQRVAPSSIDFPSSSLTRHQSDPESIQTPTHKMLDSREGDAVLRAHREILSKSVGREEELPMRSQSFDITSEEAAGNRPQFSKDPVTGQRAATFNAGHSGHSITQPRPHKLEHRVTVGPEKAWSIGTGESRNGQDGQVEKSITEVLAGIEPNARSRKASHSLGFFKEGLPEEKTKRKETRTGALQRESPPERKSSSGDEARDTSAGDGQTPPQPRDGGIRSSRLPSRVRSALHSPKVPPVSEAAEDYFIAGTESGVQTDAQAELPLRVKPSEPEIRETAKEVGPSQHTLGEYDAEVRRQSGDSTDVGEAAEDADDSSEEKISSAVFVPHQGLQEPSEIASQESREPPKLTPGTRTLSRTEDFHPWLVKADEPEVDDQAVRDHEAKDYVSSSQDSATSGPIAKVPTRLSHAPAIAEEPEVAKPALQFPHALPQYGDEHVHDHQITPKQPLDAIELIPYKHQVGGHTTLWRFSKRAVCKQLNNRENEFYERIERCHPDLLPFLPR